MFFKEKSNKEFAEILKKNYGEWKKFGLSENGYFIIFDGFMKNNKLKEISGNSLKLYLYLGLNSKNMTGEVWHSNKSIAKYFGKSERTIRLWMKELEDMHLIKRLQLEYNGISHNFIEPYDLSEQPSNYDNNLTTELKHYKYKYRLKNLAYRSTVDLTQYTESILKGITRIFPSSKVKVHSDYFEFIVFIKPNEQQLRRMGFEIKSANSELSEYVTKYEYEKKDGTLGTSSQLFERVR